MTESLAEDIESKLRVEMEATAAGADVEAHTLSSDLMDLYSRQIGAYGIELMGKLTRLQVASFVAIHLLCLSGRGCAGIARRPERVRHRDRQEPDSGGPEAGCHP